MYLKFENQINLLDINIHFTFHLGIQIKTLVLKSWIFY